MLTYIQINAAKPWPIEAVGEPLRDTCANCLTSLDLVPHVGADLGGRDLGQGSEVREGGAAHVMVDRLPLVAEAGGAARHQSLALVARIAVQRFVLSDRQLVHWRHSGV